MVGIQSNPLDLAIEFSDCSFGFNLDHTACIKWSPCLLIMGSIVKLFNTPGFLDLTTFIGSMMALCWALIADPVCFSAFELSELSGLRPWASARVRPQWLVVGQPTRRDVGIKSLFGADVDIVLAQVVRTGGLLPSSCCVSPGWSVGRRFFPESP